MRGRKPLPAATKALHGRAHRATKAKPIAPATAVPDDPADRLPPPGWLSPRATMLWLEIVAAAPWLQPIDRALLGSLVTFSDIHRRAAETVAQDGMTMTGASGAEIAHPALKILNTAALQVLRLSAALGCTPSSRQQMGIKGGEPLTRTDDHDGPSETLDQWLARRPGPKLH
jgi:P27 family predicted phage terminase small subunit